jgi:hypothetical protein
MASTRNKNTLGNYALEQRQLSGIRENIVYQNAPNGEAYRTEWAGPGLIQGWAPRTQLSGNPIDTESFLFGIGSTNLVNPSNGFAGTMPFVSDTYTLKEATTIPEQKTTIFIPPPLTVNPYNRPLLFKS